LKKIDKVLVIYPIVFFQTRTDRAYITVFGRIAYSCVCCTSNEIFSLSLPVDGFVIVVIASGANLIAVALIDE